jgi:ribosome-associated translation inhibitor RaiA
VTHVDVHAGRDIRPDVVSEARQRIEALERLAPEPPTSARLTLRRVSPHAQRPYVADASLAVDGRVLAAHAAGRGPSEAVDEVVERLRRQVRRLTAAEVAQRNEPATIRKALDSLGYERQHRPEARLKPPEEREVVRRRTYTTKPLSTLEAVSELIDLDEEFHLFVHFRSGEDVVVHRRHDGLIGLLHPRNSVLSDENDLVVPEPSRYSEPLTLADARAEMDFLNHRFLYFEDAADGRGKVLYLRHDGDYGLVEPE